MQSNAFTIRHSSFVPVYFVTFLLTQAEAQPWSSDDNTKDTGSSSSSGVDVTTQGIIAMCAVVGVVCIIGGLSSISSTVPRDLHYPNQYANLDE